MIDVKNFSDKKLTCIECGVIFPFQIGEQVYFQSKGLAEPKRCKPCRDARRATLIIDSSKAVRHDT
jgi:hypothetical protein